MSDALDWHTYVDEALKTERDLPPAGQLMHGAAGLVGEANELRVEAAAEGGESAVRSEAGDCWYYLAITWNAAVELTDSDGTAAPDIQQVPGEWWNADSLLQEAAELIETAESVTFQRDRSDETLIELWEHVHRLCDVLCAVTPGDPWDVMGENIQKLRERHGEKPPSETQMQCSECGAPVERVGPYQHAPVDPRAHICERSNAYLERGDVEPRESEMEE